jgi:hypothetical protein
MLVFKPGVKLEGIAAELVAGLITAAGVYQRYGLDECVVTSITDGKHRTGSLHYIGRAADLRTRSFDMVVTFGRLGNPKPEPTLVELDAFKHAVASTLRRSLPDDFDVIYEPTDSTIGRVEHIHIEFDPKPAPPAGRTA